MKSLLRFLQCCALCVAPLWGVAATITIPPDCRTFDGQEREVKPGTVLVLPAGERGPLTFAHLQGTPAQPIRIVNGEGRAVLRGEEYYGIKFRDCRFVRLTGTGSDAHPYGIEIAGPSTMGIEVNDLSSDVEIDHCEVHGQRFAGITAKTDPRCDLSANRGHFVMRNVRIHDNLIHHVGGEGLYIGHSFYGGYAKNQECPDTVLYPHTVVGTELYRNIVHHTDADGIQLGCGTVDCRIYDNHITFYGQNPFGPYQDNGIQLGNGTGASCFGNYIADGPGIGIVAIGLANNAIHHNVLVRTKGIRLSVGAEPADTGYRVFSNTLVDTPGPAIWLTPHTPGVHELYDNLMVGCAGAIEVAEGVEARLSDNPEFETPAQAGLLEDDHRAPEAPAPAAGAFPGRVR
ncbi:MAG: hypothetical protein E1N59_3203 [Puniceicoccaceae bacterium 5H]|nr:MAG: hypothetical protein E1N59_3203 [Puniceicoccaceae bacterium 5H]